MNWIRKFHWSNPIKIKFIHRTWHDLQPHSYPSAVVEVGCKPRVVPLRPGLSRHIPTSGLEDLPMSMCAQLYSTVQCTARGRCLCHFRCLQSVVPISSWYITLLTFRPRVPRQLAQASSLSPKSMEMWRYDWCLAILTNWSRTLSL